MALREKIAEELKCPIDLDFYEDPMILKCLHLVCKKDVDHLLDRFGSLRCPVCKRTSYHRDIKEDFRTKSLIELIQQSEEISKNRIVCDFCKRNDSEADSKCLDCNMNYCQICKEGHSKMPGLENHKFVDFVEMTNVTRERLKVCHQNIADIAQRYEISKQIWQLAKCDLDESHKNMLGEIGLSERRFISDVKQMFDDWREQLQLTIVEKGSIIEDEIDYVDSLLDDIHRKMTILHDMQTTEDVKTLMNEQVVNNVIEQSTNVPSEIIPEPDSTLKVQMSMPKFRRVKRELDNLSFVVYEGHPRNIPDKSDELTFQEDHFENQQYGRFLPPSALAGKNEEIASIAQTEDGNFVVEYRNQISVEDDQAQQDDRRESTHDIEEADIAELYQTQPFSLRNYTNPHTIESMDILTAKCDSEPKVVTCVGNELWVIMKSHKIYKIVDEPNNARSLKETITVINEENGRILVPENIIKVPTGHILAACSGYTTHWPTWAVLGLVVIDENGVVKEVIDHGKYKDVCYRNEMLFGLSVSKVIIHSYQASQWTAVNEIPFRHVFEKFTPVYMLNNAQEDAFVLASRTKLTTYVIRRDKFYKTDISSCEGKSLKPSFCDDAGNILVCHQDKTTKNQFMIIRKDSTYQSVNMPCKDRIIDATVDSQGHVICLVYVWYRKSFSLCRLLQRC